MRTTLHCTNPDSLAMDVIYCSETAPSLPDHQLMALKPFLQRIRLAQEYDLPNGVKFRQVLHFDSDTQKLAIWWW
jgi:hypothetical protein